VDGRDILKFVETFQYHRVVYKANRRDGVINFKDEAIQFGENVIVVPIP